MIKNFEVGDEVAAYDGRVGKVTMISGDHAVVCFPEPNSKQGTYKEEWRICDLGRKVNTDPTTDLKVGDRVKIADDSPLARRVLDEYAGIGPHMLQQFGTESIVARIRSGAGNIMLEDGWFWPPVLLTKLPDETAKDDSPKCVPLKFRCVVDPAPKMHNTKNAEIVFDHVVVDGKCMLKIVEIDGISVPSELPDEYKRGYPAMWEGSGNLVLYISQTRTLVYWTGFILTEEEAAKLVKRTKACGERLHKINAAARAEKDAARFAAWKAKGRKVVRI